MLEDIYDSLKSLFGTNMEDILKAGLDEILDYEYRETPLELNTRNGRRKKIVKSSARAMELNILRDMK